jgi:hypothetical protein
VRNTDRCGLTLEPRVGALCGGLPNQDMPRRAKVLATTAPVPFDGGCHKSVDRGVRVPDDSLFCDGQRLLMVVEHLLVSLKH